MRPVKRKPITRFIAASSVFIVNTLCWLLCFCLIDENRRHDDNEMSTNEISEFFYLIVRINFHDKCQGFITMKIFAVLNECCLRGKPYQEQQGFVMSVSRRSYKLCLITIKLITIKGVCVKTGLGLF
jgi:hypothetical protein